MKKKPQIRNRDLLLRQIASHFKLTPQTISLHLNKYKTK